MTQSVIAFLFVVLTGTSRPAQQRAPLPKIEESVTLFYVGEFQRIVNVNQDLFKKVLPVLQEYIQSRFDISAHRQETLMQLRMLVNRQTSTDEEIKKAIRDLDQADDDLQANQARFLSNIDPLLNVRQQGRVRIFQRMADQRMLQLINSIRNAANAPPQPDNKK